MSNRPIRFVAGWYAGPGIAMLVVFVAFLIMAGLLYAGSLLNALTGGAR